jgi:hypothetical protein
MSNQDTTRPVEAAVLPHWPARTVGVLATLGDHGPHAIPVSAPVRAGDRRILLNLNRSRDSLQRLRISPPVAVLILTAENVAFSARGQARVVREPMNSGQDYAAIEVEVEHLDDHRQHGFEVTAGVDRRWLEESERDALGRRVAELSEIADEP